MNGQSVVDFPGECRVHIALAVKDLQRSKAFYEILFTMKPTKERHDYVKFEPSDPSVNLTLNPVTTEEIGRNPVSHFGIQVKSAEAVREAIERFRSAGLPTQIEEQTTCCYALQDKVWVSDPDGNLWELFVVLENAESLNACGDSACCATSPTGSTEVGCC